MSTSGTYSFLVTRDDIIRHAMLNIGKIGEGEIPTPQESSDCALRLNMLVKAHQGKGDSSSGLKMWTRKDASLFLSSTTGKYLLGPTGSQWANAHFQQQSTATAASLATAITVPNANISIGDNVGIQLDSGALFWTTVVSLISTTGINITTGIPTQSSANSWVFNYPLANQATLPIVIETAVLRDINYQDIPLQIMNLQDYSNLPQKKAVTFISDPTAIYYQYNLTNGILETDCGAAQDVTKRIIIAYQEQCQDITNPLDNPYAPPEWFLFLTWALAKEIAPMFFCPWTEQMQMNYMESRSIAKDKDPEISSMYFQPKMWDEA